ncbi:MAG TPA: UDP-2,3-diacylglucosamine diphosphatase LpxI [Myxococcota bacterium]|nr:UDP-2,3-diacylglucosamine diphosphatase LpxI [Myxococcota bacterium]
MAHSVLGLIAGQGAFPLAVARSAKRAGRRVTCVAFRDLTDPGIAREVEDVTWIHPGEVATGIAAFRAAHVRDAVMAGRVPKAALFRNPDALHLDGEARALIARLGDRRDDTILGMVAAHLESLGIHLLPQWAPAPELLAPVGALGSRDLTPAERADVEFALPIARRMGALDIGQTIAVKDGVVLAVEAVEGTNAAIRRAGEFAAGACVVKVAKPQQDPRFDVPAVGAGTLAALVDAKARVLAIEAGATVVLEREELLRGADAHGIAVVGVSPEKPA